VPGDWNGDGRRKIGVYRKGLWLLDWDGGGQLGDTEKVYSFGGLPNDIPVVGDWNGDGRMKIGIYRAGLWMLDLNGDGKYDEAHDLFIRLAASG